MESKTKSEFDLMIIGKRMANMLFNLAQKPAFKIYQSDMDMLRKAWDEALHMLPKEAKTFWLARDEPLSGLHSIGPRKMLKIKNPSGKCFFFDEEDGTTFVIADKTLKLLGIKLLRKGQQVQLRRTPQGWEVVK